MKTTERRNIKGLGPGEGLEGAGRGLEVVPECLGVAWGETPISPLVGTLSHG